MPTIYFTLYCYFIVYTEHTLANNSYSPSVNLIPHFIYAQAAFPSDNTGKSFIYLLHVFSLMMVQKGLKLVRDNKNTERLITQ
jgi:hypothetical protein